MDRRQLAWLPFAALQIPAEAAERLRSQVNPLEELPVRAAGENKMRQVLNGETHTGFPVEMHITELPAGGAPHPPHKHAHEEMILIEQGTMEVTIEGKTKRIGPGGSAFVASNEMHGWRNVGEGRARYFVIALGRD